MDWSAHVAPHFAWSETVTANDPGVLEARRRALAADPAAQAAIVQVASVAEWIRGLVGKPVRITSGYRGPREEGSQHDTGHALDLQVDGLTALELLALVYANRAASPIPLRQVIAESNLSNVASLAKPMAKGGGTWLHVAIATGEWTRPSSKPWCTSTAPAPGRPRQYPAWTPGTAA